MNTLQFLDEHGSFCVKQPENVSALYFPLASQRGLKSAVTPNLGGDSKLNQDSFLLEPVSVDDLHNNRSGRNFWFVTGDGRAFSAVGASAEQEAAKFTAAQDDSELAAGFMWHSVRRASKDLMLACTVTSFIPAEYNVEIMRVTVENTADAAQQITPYAAVPVYGRSADNIRDHRHVTSLLHRIKTTPNGVLVCPTMSFDERGHQRNRRIYYVLGCTGDGEAPDCFYPSAEDLIGEGGSFTHPRAVYEQRPGRPAFYETAGKEAAGAFRFEKRLLTPGEKAEYMVLMGIEDEEAAVSQVLAAHNSSAKVERALAETKAYWQEQVNVSMHTGSPAFDSFMKWVSFQPFLRRLFGCSFLPHHDYGRGGRGWRDLWQDCLSLLLMEPQRVGEMIAKNFGGVRVDGTNATIIGDGDGHFIADRNGIARVWMDHALWPFMTTKLYIDQTGDIGLLLREVSYFKDAQAMRGTAVDDDWNESYGSRQLTEEHTPYSGTILEHLLIQHLTAFNEVGDHNIYRLRGADWNDALDMAAQNGESVAFTCAYAGNLVELAALLRLLDGSGHDSVELLEELEPLLDGDKAVFDDAEKKRRILSEYTSRCKHNVSGRRKRISLSMLSDNLLKKAGWLGNHIRGQEWIDLPSGEGWFNSYYDNHGRPVEGIVDGQVRMMLTGQVFAIMGRIATDAQIEKIVRSADHYLYRKEIGGYRLNTDFHELKFDMGRMFGFAYGEKENGAVFSHMAVMYANALYRRGFAKEGWKALKTLFHTALDFDTSRIYPGIPEYFRADGRGMYHYLTGAASWYMLTVITEAFGVRGEAGDLLLQPKLLAEQFDGQGIASIRVTFAEKELEIVYENKERKDYGSYKVVSAVCAGTALTVDEASFAVVPRALLRSLPAGVHRITMTLD